MWPSEISKFIPLSNGQDQGTLRLTVWPPAAPEFAALPRGNLGGHNIR